jgi:hypothetical protein
MTRHVEVSIVGYDRGTERVVAEHPIPPTTVTAAMPIANVPPTDPDLVGAYPLDAEQARQIAELINVTIDPANFDWFLEADAPEC